MTVPRTGPEKGINAGAQALAAVVLVGGLAGGMWVMAKDSGQEVEEVKPAACSADHEAARPSKRVSGAQLCTALNRSDLPELLGTPAERAESADGSESSTKLAGGTTFVTPEAKVTLKTYTVQLSASYDDFTVAGMAGLLGSAAEKRTVLGRPAVLSSDRTIAIRFRFDGGKPGKADTAPGGIARRLQVARNAKDGGGSFEVVVWRQDEGMPDDAALLRVAEKVLPTIPGWDAGPTKPRHG
ncbi:DUF6215 domain-containing protein [Streptomyces endophytica]|uniref:DUF6215 domain-containing protein n=1 Tax=Streptomyces endophytica TaxID=2991496 RepID=A0ABY6PEY6_9ACTN|nr:DUF6215 domain-containing protein [Streptomyces endophytica]UZJ32428.1 DUF6215 domain-containing protein [Streptomyces endophytica]